MIFATVNYSDDYSNQHRLIQNLLAANFADVQGGLQGDSWIWVRDGDQEVSVDSFTSMKHEVKAKSKDGGLAKRVIEVLRESYELTIFDPPEIEAHE